MVTPDMKASPRSWDIHGLPDWCLEAVSSFGYTETTPVQAAVLPLLLGNSDCVVEAPTGSGKTISFLLPICARILRQEEPTKKHHIASIIVSPTRELAAQIHSVLVSLIRFHGPSADILPLLKEEDKRPETASPIVLPQLVVGGVGKPATDLSFFLRHRPNLIVATPGRLAELLSSQYVNSTGSFDMLVLDEADRILELGFAQDLSRILACLPKQRRTSLFSASVTDALDKIIRVNLRNPKRVVVRVKMKDGSSVEEKKTPASLTMAYVVLPASQKVAALLQLLEKLSPMPQRSIVFLSSCYAVKYFAAVLPSLLPPGVRLFALHGKMEPTAREKSFSRFTSSSSPCILITTDLASRGLDIPAVDLVVNYDPPTDVKTFVHRCGRSGRAGRRGLAVTMLLPGPEEDFIPFMSVRQTPISPLAEPQLDVTPEAAGAASAAIRAQALADREVYQLAQRGFVSFLRSYQEHRARSIFRVEDLDLVDLAHGWGLLELPKMPELKARGIVDRSLGLGFDIDAVPFKDKTKEKKRLAERAERLTAAAGTAGSPSSSSAAATTAAAGLKTRKRNEAWSEKHDRDDVRVARREKKRRKRDAEKEAKMTDREKEDRDQLKKLLAEVRRKNQEAEEENKQPPPPTSTQGRALKENGAAGSLLEGRGDESEDEFEGFDD